MNHVFVPCQSHHRSPGWRAVHWFLHLGDYPNQKLDRSQRLRPAYIAAIVIAILIGLVKWLLGSTVGRTGSALINWIISAIILLLAGRMVKGMKVNGFGSALLAAAVIALFDW